MEGNGVVDVHVFVCVSVFKSVICLCHDEVLRNNSSSVMVCSNVNFTSNLIVFLNCT